MNAGHDMSDDGSHLALQQCLACHIYQHYPREICRRCHSRDLRCIDACGRGTVYSHTTIRRAPSPGGANGPSRILVLVELEEGPRVLATLELPEHLGPKIGMPVEAWFEDTPEHSQLLRFRPRRP